MKPKARTLIALVVACAALSMASTIEAETIMTLNLDGNLGANLAFSGGEFSTVDDGDVPTAGERNASIELMTGAPTTTAFAAFATSEPSSASFTISGIQALTPSTTFSGSLLVQNFQLGSLAVYDASNSLLLGADLTLSAITGALGSTDSEALFLAFGEITGGSLKSELKLDPDSLRLKMKLPEVQGGFSVSPAPNVPPPPLHLGTLDSFTAITLSIEILATVVPEPACGGMLIISAAMIPAARRRRR